MLATGFVHLEIHMFTGIIQGTAEVLSADVNQGVMRLVVEFGDSERLKGLQTGASIALNGTCLTVVEFSDTQVSFDLIGETLRLTNLSQVKAGSQVNFERAAKFGDEIGGHLLSGHIHTQAEVVRVEPEQDNLSVYLQVAEAWREFVLPKGYIALDGASLTIGEKVEEGIFSVHLIPETLRLTTIGSRRPGDKINVEIDSQTQAVVETVKRYLAEK